MPIPPRAPRRRRRSAFGLVLPLLVTILTFAPAAPAGAQAAPPLPAYGAIFDGQSNTLFPGPAHCYPTVFMARYMPGVPFANVAIGGTSYPERTESAPTRVDPLAQAVDTAYLFTEGGASDIFLEGASPERVIESIRTYIEGRRAAGYDAVVSATILPGTVYDAAQDARRLAVNQLLRDHHREIGIDVLVDVAGHPLLQSAWNPTIFSDGIHLTAVGAEIVAWIYAAALMESASRA